MYKDVVGIPPLGMVDDLVCISQCGPKTVMLNSFVNYKASSKKLQFGTQKCKKLHIGQQRQLHKCASLFIDGWKAQPSECGRQRTLNIVHTQTAAQQQSIGSNEARMSRKCGELRD